MWSSFNQNEIAASVGCWRVFVVSSSQGPGDGSNGWDKDDPTAISFHMGSVKECQRPSCRSWRTQRFHRSSREQHSCHTLMCWGDSNESAWKENEVKSCQACCQRHKSQGVGFVCKALVGQVMSLIILGLGRGPVCPSITVLTLVTECQRIMWIRREPAQAMTCRPDTASSRRHIQHIQNPPPGDNNCEK